MILVRPARVSELAAVGELTVTAYAADGLLVEDDPYADHLRDAVARAREAEVYVAVVDDQLAGTVTFCPQGSPWSEIAQPGEGEFRMLAVAPACRRPRRRTGPGRGVPGAIDRARLHGRRAVQPRGPGARAPRLRRARLPPAPGAGLVAVPGRRPDGVPSRPLSVSSGPRVCAQTGIRPLRKPRSTPGMAPAIGDWGHSDAGSPLGVTARPGRPWEVSDPVSLLFRP